MSLNMGHTARRPISELLSSSAAAKLGPITTLGTIASAPLKAKTAGVSPILAIVDSAGVRAAKAGLATTLALTAKFGPTKTVGALASEARKAEALAAVPVLAALGPVGVFAAKGGSGSTLPLTAKSSALRRWQRDCAEALEAAAQHWKGQQACLARMAPHRVGRALMLARDLRTGMTPTQARQVNLGYTVGEAVDFLATSDARDHETARLAAAYLQGTLFRALAAGHVVGVIAISWARLAAQGAAHAACAKLVTPPIPAAPTVGPLPRPQAVHQTSKPQRLSASVILPDRAPPVAMAVA